VGAVQALTTTFLEIEEGKRQRSGDEYLVRTGAVHSLIEMARSGNILPKDNLTAVRHVWTEDAGALADGVREVGDMIEDSQSETDIIDEEDGWDELGIEPNKPLTEEELERAKKVLIVLRLCNILHKKVVSDILSASSSLSNSDLDSIAPLSSAMLSASDELISALDSPQDFEYIMDELNALKDVIDAIRSRLNQFNSLVNLIENSSLNDPEVLPSTSQSSREKWFKGCFDQIAKAIQMVGTGV